MQQISNNVIMMAGGEPMPTQLQGGQMEEYLKVSLLGTSDLNPDGSGDWQSKFTQGLGLITDPNKGVIMYKNMKFLVMNCKSMGVNNPNPTYDNPEFMNRVSIDFDYAQTSDAIFLNLVRI